MSAIKRNQITIPRFRFNLSTQDALDLLAAHYQIAVEFRHCDFVLDENTKRALVKLAIYLTDTNPKFGVLLCGTCGNGKTTMVYALQKTINYLNSRNHFNFLGKNFEIGMPLLDAKELVDISRNPKRFDEYRTRTMLAIDDMGKELLLVVYENGTLSRYEADTAQFTGKTDITVSALSTLYSAGFEHDAEQGLLYVQVGNNMDVVETDTFVEVAKVVGCFGHHKETDTFITSAFEDTSYDCMMGYFEHYSVDRLIQKTRDHLQGEEMSEDQKSMYGIGG